MNILDEYVAEDQFGYYLRRISQFYSATFNEILGDSQLTPVQFFSLLTIYKLKSTSQKELVRATHIDQATIRGIIERLKAREFINLLKDPNDNRKSIISLTKSGEAILIDVIPQAHEVTKTMFEPLNPAEELALRYLLDKVLTYQIQRKKWNEDYL